MKESKYPKIGNVNCERSLPTQSLLNISASTFSFLLRTISFIYIVSHTFQCAIILCFHESALLTLRLNSPFKNTTLTTKINKCFVIHYYKEKYSKYCCYFSRIQRLSEFLLGSKNQDVSRTFSRTRPQKFLDSSEFS